MSLYPWHKSKSDLLDELIKLGIITEEGGKVELTKAGALLIQKPALDYSDVSIVPKFNNVYSRKEVNLETQLTRNIKIPSPLVAANMECVTNASFIKDLWKNNIAGVLHRFFVSEALFDKEYRELLCLAESNGFPVLLSCGSREQDFENLKRYVIDFRIDAIVIDIAHGHSAMMIDQAKRFKTLFNTFGKRTELILGNVCTAQAVRDLAPYADAIKVGVSNGGVCQTQVKTGAGFGQITAVIECAEEAKKYGIPIICDGGINEPGDVMKALVAGASSAMAGKIFARCPESAAQIIERDGYDYKLYYGMASNVLKNKIYGDTKKHVASEGIAIELPVGASIYEFFPEYLAALRSSFTYSGSKNISELWKNGELRRNTEASFEKGKPHAVIEENARKLSN